MIFTDTFLTAGNGKENLCLQLYSRLTANEAIVLRKAIQENLATGYDKIYIDARDVAEADLSGINEIIHSSYVMRHSTTKLVFAYCKNSIIEKWIETTGLDSFIFTAQVPAA